jgi:Heterokaryon incompatibility protein (HET)
MLSLDWESGSSPVIASSTASSPLRAILDFSLAHPSRKRQPNQTARDHQFQHTKTKEKTPASDPFSLALESLAPPLPRTPYIQPQTPLYHGDGPDILFRQDPNEDAFEILRTIGRSRPPEVFNYTPLVHDDEIRLIRLLPGERSTPVRCDLIHARLSEDPKYSALSYVWGGSSHIISVPLCESGASVYVTENGYAALKRLRRLDRDRLVWIDAVCIHQSNPWERNHQVRQMKAIYSAAESVVVHLDEQGEGARELWGAMDANDPGTLDSRLIANLFTLPYFSRIWMIQEVCFARNLEILFGDCTFDENLFRHLGAGSRYQSSRWERPLALTIRYMLPTQRTLWRLLWLAKDHHATDRRDKIIALLGVATDVPDEVKTLLADYNASEAFIWQLTLMWIFLTWEARFTIPPTIKEKGIGAQDRQLLDWRRALYQCRTRGRGEKSLCVIEMYDAEIEPKDSIPVRLARLDCRRSRARTIVQVGCWSSVRLLQAAWTSIHNVLWPRHDSNAQIPATGGHPPEDLELRLAMTDQGELCLFYDEVRVGDWVTLLDSITISVPWPEHIR